MNPLSVKKPTAHMRLQIERVIDEFRSGIHRSAVAGVGIDFRNIRDYDPADPISRIDWSASARLSDDDSVFVVREYHPDLEIGVVCAIDVGPSMESPARKREYSEWIAWLFALSAFRYRDRFRLIFFDRTSVNSSEWGKTEEWLPDALFETEATDLCAHLNGLNLKNTLLVVISDFNQMSPEYIQRFRTLDYGARNIKGIFVALDEWDGFEPQWFRSSFVDAVSGAMRQLDLRRGKSAHREAEAQQQCFEQIRKTARPLGVSFIQVPLISDEPLSIVRRELLKQGFE